MNEITNDGFLGIETKTMIKGKGFIETVNPKKIQESDITSIFHLEQDMWAHGLKEYVECLECGNIDGKYDVFDERILGPKLIKNTVSDIEKILGHPKICCSKCQGPTKKVFGDEHREDIVSRYKFQKSFLNIYRDIGGKVRGFIDGYVTDFDTIYDREFSHYYGQVGREEILRKIEDKIGNKLSKKLLCVTALGMDEVSANMFIIYALMKQFFYDVSRYDSQIYGIYESVLGTNTHGIYESCGALLVNVLEGEPGENTHEGMKSDIFIHPNIGPKFVLEFGESLREFLHLNGRRVKEIVELHA